MRFKRAPSGASVSAGTASTWRAKINILHPFIPASFGTFVGTWIIVNDPWPQHFGPGHNRGSGPIVSSTQAHGKWMPTQDGTIASPSSSLMGANSGRKGRHTGSVIRAATLERFPNRTLPGPDAVTFSTDNQLSPTQPVTRRVKAAPTIPGQSVRLGSPPPNV